MLFILTDQHRVDTLGTYGNTENLTPALDALAASGTRFDRWYTPSAICTPARASLLTGQAPFRHKLLANTERNVGYIEDLADGVFTFSEELVDAGYNVGLVGKWHVGANKSARDFGFDAVDYVGWHNPVDHPDYLEYLSDNGFPPYRIHDQIRGRLPNGAPGNLLAARLDQPAEATFEHYLTTRAIEKMERYAADRHEHDKPFFLGLHYFGPHLPYIVPDQYFDLVDPDRVRLPASTQETFFGKPEVQRNYSAHWSFDTMPLAVTRKLIAVYWGYVSMIDAQIQRLLTAATDLGLIDDTAVFFSCDHGEFTGAHRLHDKGPAMYEDIYHTPGIIRVPGGVPGQTRDEFVSLLDCTATILELAGRNPEQAVDSRSLLELVNGDEATQWADDIVCEFHGHHFPYPQRMIRTDRFKLIVNPESVNELYDLVADPDELHNRYDHPELQKTRDELMATLYQRLMQRGDNFYHWMTSMYNVGVVNHDPTLSAFDGDAYRDPSPAPVPMQAGLTRP